MRRPHYRTKGQTVGWLHVGERANVIEQLLRDIAFDILTVLVVATLVAFELVRLLLRRIVLDASARAAPVPRRRGRRRFSPLSAARRLRRDRTARSPPQRDRRGTQQQHPAQGQGWYAPSPEGFSFDTGDERVTLRVNSVESIRWPFFLLIFSESLSLSFFPNFVAEFYDPAYGLPRNVVIGLPITVFMLVWAITMPFAGTWCDRVGYRKAFTAGAVTTTAGLILTAYSTGLWDLLVWRSITAIGYGIVYVTAQAYITTYIPPSERTRGQAMFLASFFRGLAVGCGHRGNSRRPAPDFRMTFLLSAGLSAITAVYVSRFPGTKSGRRSPKKRLALADFKLLLQHKQFAAITFFSAIPAKVALAGFLYYSVPLYLKGLGYNQSITGRVMMAYGLAIILVSPIMAQLADRVQNRWRFLMIGGYAAAIAMAIPLFVDDMTGAALAVIGLGIAHAIGVSPQMALINDRCGDTVREVGQATTVGIFRLVERIGTITGPILLGVMIALSDFMGAFVILAVFTFTTTTIFTLLLLWFDRGDSQPQTA